MPRQKPVNLEDMQLLEIEEISINEWHPFRYEVESKPTQVHMLFKVKQSETRLVLRFKSRSTLDQIVADLKKHADAVWPKGE